MFFIFYHRGVICNSRVLLLIQSTFILLYISNQLSNQLIKTHYFLLFFFLNLISSRNLPLFHLIISSPLDRLQGFSIKPTLLTHFLKSYSLLIFLYWYLNYTSINSLQSTSMFRLCYQKRSAFNQLSLSQITPFLKLLFLPLLTLIDVHYILIKILSLFIQDPQIRLIQPSFLCFLFL